MKSTKVTDLPQNGEGTMHEVPRLRTKARGTDKGADKPRPLEDIYSLGIKGRAHSCTSNLACRQQASEHWHAIGLAAALATTLAS